MTDDLVKRLRELAGRYDEAAERIEKLEAALDEAAFSQTLFDAVVGQRNKATDRIEKLEQLFDLRWAADMRAIKAWQIAHPDQPKTWPDHADLGTWCLSRIEKLEAALREIAEANNVQAGTDKDMYRRWRRVATNAIDIARKALEGKDE